MSANVKLKSRLPSIEKQLGLTVAKSLDRAAGIIAEAAQNRVPVDTGRLRDAIHVEKQASGGTYSTRRVVAGDSDVFYGHLVEYGTVNTPAEPFLIPAYEATKAQAEALIRMAISRL